MPKLNPISHSNFVKRLKKLWFEWPYSGWKHLFMSKWNLDLTIPNKHSNKDFWVGLLSRILKQAWVSIDEWNKK